jgi:restriction system protein
MAEITSQRSGQFLRVIFELLMDKPDGLPAKDILSEIPKTTQLTEFESGYYPSTPNSQRFEKIVRFATIGPVKAGWLVKSKGRWFITEEGKQAYRNMPDPEKLFKEASRLYQVWKKSRPEEDGIDDEGSEEITKAGMTLDEVEELAREQIQGILEALNPYEFQDLVANLLTAMGYYIYWVAPPGKDGGIDIIAYNDPLGANGPRVKVQVKHKINTPTPVEQLRAFMSVIGTDEIGLFVSSGGFTSNVWDESRSQDKRKITLIDLDSLIDLWIQHYPKIPQDGRQKLPLKPIYFPATSI